MGGPAMGIRSMCHMSCGITSTAEDLLQGIAFWWMWQGLRSGTGAGSHTGAGLALAAGYRGVPALSAGVQTSADIWSKASSQGFLSVMMVSAGSSQRGSILRVVISQKQGTLSSLTGAGTVSQTMWGS